MSAPTVYGDISPAVAAYAAKQFLTRGLPYLCLENFGLAEPLPEHSTRVIKFTRYNSLDDTPRVLQEGVVPAGQKLTSTNVTLYLDQYGDYIPLSDVVMNTHTDPVLMQAVDVLGEQAARMIEKVRFGTLKATTNVFFANGSTIGAVNTAFDLATQRRVTRSLKRQNGSPITKIIRSTPDWGVQAVRPSWIGLAHPDMEPVIRSLTGFQPAELYGTMTPYENELGKCEDVRYLTSTIFEPTLSAGGAPGGLVLSTNGANADIYPVMFLGAMAYGLVALKGMFAVQIMVANPKPVAGSDPLAQQGSAGWKSMQGAIILNDMWLARLNSAAPV